MCADPEPMNNVAFAQTYGAIVVVDANRVSGATGMEALELKPRIVGVAHEMTVGNASLTFHRGREGLKVLEEVLIAM